MVLYDENQEIIERNGVERDCAKLCSGFVESTDGISQNQFTRHIETAVLIEIASIHTIRRGCIEINVQSWFLRVINRGINASIVKHVDLLFRLVSALSEVSLEKCFYAFISFFDIHNAQFV